MAEEGLSKKHLQLRRRKAKKENGEGSSDTFSAASNDGATSRASSEELSTKRKQMNNEGDASSGRTALKSVGKVASVAKENLVSKPLSATKKMVKDVSEHKKKVKKGVDTVSSTFFVPSDKKENEKETGANVSAKNSVIASHEDDRSTIVIDNSIHETQLNQQKKGIIVRMGPLLSILLHDATVYILTSLAIAAYPTVHYYNLITANAIPFTVALTWILVAFTVGYQVALYRFLPIAKEEEIIADYSTLTDVDTIPFEIEMPMAAQPKRGYSIMRSLSVKFPSIKIELPQTFKTTSGQAWSSLTTKRGQQMRWQRSARGRVSRALSERLLRNPSYSRRTIEVDQCDAQVVGQQKIGSFELPDAESLKEDVIEPLFKLRGMDIFLSEGEGGAEDNISEHPFLIENGLRDTPSFVLNAMTHWANILLYFEMPSLGYFDDINEQEEDPDDVKALKKFINGDAEYKTLRFKLLPYLVDGPMAIKMLAPPKYEYTIHCERLPTKWRQVSASTRESDGRFLHPCLEVELDLMANKTVRGFASLAKRYLSKMSVDVAVTIDKPDLQEQDELSACVAMWRFDRVDLSQCPMLPARDNLGHGERADVVRASMLLREQMQHDLQQVQQEEMMESIPETEAVAA